MKKFLSTILLVAAALSGCDEAGAKKEPNAAQSPAAQEFNQLQEIALAMPGGAEFKLARKSLKNKDLYLPDTDAATLFVFFTTWCEPCLIEIPTLNSLAKKFGSKLRVIGVLMEEKSPEALEKFIAKSGARYEIASGAANFTFMQALGGFSGIPYAALYDKAGANVANYTGIILEEMLDIDITRAIK